MNIQSDDVAAEPGPSTDFDRSHYDVFIVGAGISGIDAGRHLRHTLPDKSFAIIERADSIGGTWRVHKYPGVRSDSDLHTFGYAWKPWKGPTLAEGGEILAYLDEAVEEEGLASFIRFGWELAAADWSDEAQCWRLTLRHVASGAEHALTATFLWMCCGYYDHDRGHEPEFPGQELFPGPIVHPQRWPEGEDFAGQRVAVIGSGATAATLVPALAKTAAHVTIVQRSPTYYFAKPKVHELAELLRPLGLDDQVYHDIMRRRHILEGAEVYRRAFEEPETLRSELIEGARQGLNGAADIEPHFTPEYMPWRQRLAAIPDGDLYAAIREGKANFVTGHIETLTEAGILLTDGSTVEADVIVSATGLRMTFLDETPFGRNGQPIDFSDCWTWRGVMTTGAPNMAWVFGYLRASWTLRANLVSELVCRLLSHMDAADVSVAEAVLRQEDLDMTPRLFIEPENFNAGYIVRAMEAYPRQGDHIPWTAPNVYTEEAETMPAADLDDGSLRYS